MDEITRDCLVSIAAFAAIFGIAYIYLVSRHRERITMLERGVDPKSFQKEEQPLKYGMMAIGIAIGTVAGGILKMNGVERNTSYISMIFLFSGISLVIYHLLTRKRK